MSAVASAATADSAEAESGETGIDRIFIERGVCDGRRTVQQTAFEPHVVHSANSGTAHEDTVAILGESEREVMGLLFALAGHITHEIYEGCPFVLLDSLQVIDTDRMATRVESFADDVPYLVVAFLPEDATGLTEPHRRIEEI